MEDWRATNKTYTPSHRRDRDEALDDTHIQTRTEHDSQLQGQAGRDGRGTQIGRPAVQAKRGKARAPSSGSGAGLGGRCRRLPRGPGSCWRRSSRSWSRGGPAGDGRPAPALGAPLAESGLAVECGVGRTRGDWALAALALRPAPPPRSARKVILLPLRRASPPVPPPGGRRGKGVASLAIPAIARTPKHLDIRRRITLRGGHCILEVEGADGGGAVSHKHLESMHGRLEDFREQEAKD